MSSSSLTRFLVQRSCRSHKTLRKICTQSYTDENYSLNDKPPHIPVMLNEVISHLNLKEGQLFLDMTFGAGGHSSALLEKIPNLHVIALDRDPIAQEYANKLKNKYPDQVTPVIGKFSELPNLLKSINIEINSIDGILFDLGCSSMQFDYAERGFSVSKNGPLDMRMDGNRSPNDLTAADVIANASENELNQIFRIYAGEKKSQKIARAIVDARYTFKPLKTTRNLCDLVETVCSNEHRSDKLRRKTHTATKVFQALRIFVNNEINELNYGILLAQRYLKLGGRAVAISFHSLEDVVVKRHFTNQIVDNCIRPLPLMFYNSLKYYSCEEIGFIEKKYWEVINKKVIVPSEKEVTDNPRSRSAKLRGAIKI